MHPACVSPLRRLSSVLASVFTVWSTTLPLLATPGTPTVTATKSADTSARKNQGDSIVYTITVANSGTADALGVTLTDAAPANTADVANTLDVTPLARDDVYGQTVLANMSVTSSTSVVTNDFAGYLNGSALGATDLTITAVGNPTHGAVSMTTTGANIGKFTYTPAAGYVGSDSFTYTIGRTGVTETVGTLVSRTATVTLTVGGPVIWFVDNTNGSDANNGTLGHPFKTLAKVSTVDAAGTTPQHAIFVYSGAYSSTTGLTLKNNEILAGQSSTAASFDALFSLAPGSDTPARPTLNSTKPVVAVTSGTALTLGSGNTVTSITITNTSGNAHGIAGSAIGTATLADIAVATVGGGTAFSVGTSGTLTLTGAANTLNATNGIALSVQNVGIGAGGLTFKSISASGAANGIVLLNTGSSAGLTVTGDGTDATLGGNGSGGTIQNTTGTAIALNNTRSPSLSYVTILNPGATALTALSVGGLTINRCTFTDVSPAEGFDDNILIGDFASGTAVSGTIAITNSKFTDAPNDNIAVGISSGTSSWTVTGNTFSGNNNIGFNLEFRGTSVISALALTNNTFNGHYTSDADDNAEGIHIQPASGTTGSLVATITGNTFANNNLAIDVNDDAAATTTYTISSNTVVNDTRRANLTSGLGSVTSHAINAFMATTSTSSALMNLRLENNTIGNAGIAGSGSSIGNGIRVNFNGNGTGRVLVNNNTIRETPLGRGIEIIGRNGTGTLDATITNNNVSHYDLPFDTGNGSDFPLGAIVVLSNTPTTSGYIVRTDIRGNIVPTSSATGQPAAESPAKYISLKLSNTTGGSALHLVNTTSAANATAQLTSANTGDVGAGAGVDLIIGALNQPPLLLASAPIASTTSVSAQPTSAAAATSVELSSAVLPESATLTQTDLDRTVTAALVLWEASGLTAEQDALLRSLRFDLADLPGVYLGQAGAGSISVDADAGGRGWFVATAAPLATDGRVDLLTAILHEMGHALGLDDTYSPADRDDIMFGWLAAGQRRLPALHQAAGAQPHADGVTHFLAAPVTIGTLPIGKQVVVTFTVTITAKANVSNAASVSGSNFATIASNTAANEVEQPPVVSDFSKAALEDTMLTFGASDFTGKFSDPNSGDTLNSVTLVSLPTHGVLKVGASAATAGQTVAAASLATITYTPATNYYGSDSFTWNASDGTLPANSAATITLSVAPVADTPSITAATTAEDTQSATGLVISRNIVDSTEVTHFKITNLVNGRLYKNNGTTEIVAGDFITFAEGNAGLKFTPAADKNSPSSDTFSFDVQGATDAIGTGLSSAANAAITITEVNDVPVPANDSLSAIDEDSAVRTISFASLVANDSTGPANESTQTLVVASVANPVGGTVQISGTDVLFTPAADFNGAASFTYKITDNGTTNAVSDPQTSTASATVSFTVNAVNDAPVITAPATLSGTPDVAVAVTGVSFADDSGANSVVVTFSSSGGSTAATTGGNVTVGGTAGARTLTGTLADLNAFLSGGGVTFTAAANTTLTIGIDDQGNTGTGGAKTDSKNIAISLAQAPVITASGGTTSANERVATPVDPALTVTDVDSLTLAAATVSITGNFANAEDALSFTNDGSTMGNVVASYNSSIGVLTLTSSDATATLAQWQAALRAVAFTDSAHAPNTATRTISFAVNDGGLGSTAATKLVAVIAVNEAPTLTNVSTLTGATEDIAFTIAYADLASAANAADIEGDTLSFRVEAVSSGTLTNGVSPVVAGATLLAADESFVWTPAANASGTVNAFTVVAYDGALPSATPVQVAVTVTSVNDTPTLDVINNPAAILEDAGAQTINLAGISAGGGESQTLTITATSNNTALIPNPTVTYTSPNATGSLSYTPVANASGTATITVTVQDNGGTANSAVDLLTRTFTVTVTSVNDTPTLDVINNPAAILEDAGAQTINLAGISAGGGESQTLTVTATSDNTALIPNPTVNYTSPNATGSLSYTPVANASGTATITVTVTDNGGTANGATNTIARTFTVAVTSVNDTPTLDVINNPAAILEDAGAQTINLAGISAGGGESQTLTITATSNNTALIPNPTVTYTSPNTTGSLSYTPVANASGTATITVTVQDNGGTANSAVDLLTRTFTVTVTSVNDTPTLDVINNPAAILEDAGAQTINLAGISAGGGESQTLTITATSNNTAVIPNPTVTYTNPNATGSLSYTPVANASGTATITVTVQDNGGTANSAVDLLTRTFTVTVTSVNDTPTLDVINNPAAILEDAGAQTINLAGISAGGGESQTLTIAATSNNTAVIPNPTVTYTSPNATGSLSYTPVANASGTATITVTVKDNGGTANGASDTITRTFTVTVTAVNDAPTLTAVSTLTSATEDTPFTISYADLFAASDAADTEGDAISFRIEAVSSGTLTKGGVAVVSGTTLFSTGESLVWTPAANANGTLLAFTVTASDGVAVSSTPVQVSIAVAPVNDAPVLAVSATAAYSENAAATQILGGLSATDIDSATFAGATVSIAAGTFTGSGDVLSASTAGTSITASYNSATKILTLSGTDTKNHYGQVLFGLTYASTSDDPTNGGANPTRTITWQIDDGGSVNRTSNVATTTLTIAAVNDAPTISGAVAGQTVTDKTTLTPFSGVTVADPDSPSLTLTVALDAVAKGALSNPGTGLGSYDASTGVYTVSGSATAVTAALRTLVFTPAENRVAPASTETTTFTISANDSVATPTIDRITTVVTTSVDDAPTGLALSAASVTQSSSNNIVVGTLSTTDADTSDTFTYTLVAGAGSTDNASFNLLGDKLRANAPSSLAPRDYTVRLRTTDASSAPFEQAFTIAVTDNVAPTVVSVAGPAAGIYGVGTALDFTVTFSEPVTVDATAGTPTLALTLAGNAVDATYLTGSTTTALVFRYIVKAGDHAAAGEVVLGAIALNGGTVRDVSANDAILLFSPPAQPGVIVEARFHSADTNQDWAISLGELLRVIELYNTKSGTTRTGDYRTATTTTDDGYEAGAGAITGPYHSADSNHDGQISLGELLRVIELYNTKDGTTRTGIYHRSPGTEDGFATGPDTNG